MVNKKKNWLTERDLYKMSEKELYSKICVAESIKHVDNASDEVIDMKDPYKFSYNLATILARDREVVAVRLKISDDCKVYISKNDNWYEEDVRYIDRIQKYLRNISKESPGTSIESSIKIIEDLTDEVMTYCFAKLEYRFEKLEKDIIRNRDKEHIKSFIRYARDNLEGFDPDNLHDVDKSEISGICCAYYKEAKNVPGTPEKFLGHLKKVGSYAGSVIDIAACARNEKYKNLFSNIKLRILKPVIADQLIYSWEDIIKGFVRDHVEYEKVKNECLNDSHIAERLRKIYGDENTNQLQLDVDNIKQRVCLHAEMNILANIIDQGDKSRVYIAVSKRYCYLCELYIDFARKRGYNIIISGKHKKIYRGWKLPFVADANFRIQSLKYILENLDQIIESQVKHYTKSLRADSDSRGSSVDSENRSEAEVVFGYLKRGRGRRGHEKKIVPLSEFNQ
ncbi:hypothetical protein C1645_803154 [Glomus cerebriforme]|uniref:Uncharacterized protein n=1 Tax=Glomus cerebriforme TaxID=658196 RepID=A0A397TJQ4_9GLOM|nr:hypothetical protein C1645_803154 [Glomus cerebriforme]